MMKESPPLYNTKLENKHSLILEPKLTPSSTQISVISKSLVLIHNYELAQVSNARIHQLDDSTWLEVSTLASLALPNDVPYIYIKLPNIQLFEA